MSSSISTSSSSSSIASASSTEKEASVPTTRGCGKVILVTGCSSGIGLHLALSLSSPPSDYHVIATVRNKNTAPASLLSQCDVVQADVTSEDDVQRLKDHVNCTYNGRCDVLVNNAGYGVSGSLEDVSVEAAKRVFDVNLWGPMRLCQMFVPMMRAHGGGLILTVSSVSGVIGMPYSDVYTASKFAIEGLMESFRYAVQNDNIKVVSINPSATKTAFSTRFRKEAKKSGVAAYWAQQLADRNARGQPAEECAMEIVKVMEREMGKNVVDGKECAVLWNGTSQFSKAVIENVKVSPDGMSGIYKERFEIGRRMHEEAKLFGAHRLPKENRPRLNI